MKNNQGNMCFNPIISSIQRIALYETKARFYLMGSNNQQTKFRVLKIDRLDPKELIVVDDNVEYSKEEIRTMVTMLDNGNRTRMGQRLTNSGVKLVSAFGIIGFVRFLEGYYIILITKRRRVAIIGHHTIYKIEDTQMISIPNDDVRLSHPDEPRYLKMFQNIDLSSNFYFSYSYDITHTLQHNMSVPKYCFNKPDFKDCDCFNVVCKSDHTTPIWKFSQEKLSELPIDFGVVSEPNDRFVWNRYLLRGIENSLHSDWILYVTHGFVGQSNMSVFGRSMLVTLIARRSSKYAGTRFFKRGANFQGDVANEVETEQLVHDANISCLRSGRFSSFVQIRGSVPVFWSQDPNKMVPKPPINFDLSDPYNEVAGKHFNQLLTRYGSPIIVLNLVKKREKKKHESMLSIEFLNAIKYLNQFLPYEHHIQYISFDMARMNKGKEANVMGKLGNIAHNAVCKTGIYLNKGPYTHNDHHSRFRYQTGLIRVNCVDCLDRTNTAQFAVGKCALGFQLSSLGIIESPNLEFDSDCVRMLEGLYEDHGDTLALQYGGSQLVHRIKTYRKTAPWTSQGNDIMQTLSRYYSNTFSDSEKQHTINIFLGIFIPDRTKPPIWDMQTDYYLHQQFPNDKNNCKSLTTLCQWWDTEVIARLPLAHDDFIKSCRTLIKLHPRNEQIDGYLDYHRPFEFTVLSEMFAYKISHSVRDFMPHFTTNFSPFTVRVRPVRRRDESTNVNKDSIKNPSLTGRSSTSSTTSSTSSSDDSEESEDDLTMANSDSQPSSGQHSNSLFTPCFKSLFRSMNMSYGIHLNEPTSEDASLYQRYTQKLTSLHKKKYFDLEHRLNHISRQSIETYKHYLKIKEVGAEPLEKDLIKYQKYTEIATLRSSILSEE